MDASGNSFNWLGVIGAAAWIPQILVWFQKLITKPKVNIIPASTVEIGFSNLGPIVNLPVAFLVKGKDALITGVTLRAIRENGETHLMQWMWIHEVVTYIRGLPANMNLAKQDKAIALLASTKSLLEKTIGFQDPDFQEKYRDHYTALMGQFAYLRDRPNGKEEFLQSRELANGFEWFTKALYWTDGRLRLEIELKVEGLRSPVKAAFSTAISKPEVALLLQNVEKMKAYVLALVKADPTAGPVPEPIWNWITTRLSA
jgi:hypothetical protein